MKKEEEEDNNSNNHQKASLSETTRNIFFKNNTRLKSLLTLPSSFLFIITAKGLHPPPYKPINIPIKSLSVPIKLITMTEHYEKYNKATIPSMKKSTSLPTNITFKKPTPIEALITTTQRKTTTLVKKKKSVPEKEQDEEDEPMTKPLSLTEKRKRQAKRADQVKIWKVREEREAREARLLIRRQIVNGTKKVTTATETTTTTIRKKKKRVKFNFDKNSIITIQYDDE